MKVYRFDQLNREELRRLTVRNPIREPELLKFCQEIFDEVGRHGDEAVKKFTRQFDGVEISDLQVHAREFQEGVSNISAEVVEALQHAASNIRKFHSAQTATEGPVTVQQGVTCWRAARAVHSVGLYVPSGTAPLPSTVLMLGVPAKLAGCRKIILCVPPQKDGTVAPAVLAAAQVAGIRQVFRIGGAQAVAAMALGTETVPRVDKILGPGNRYVQTAKLIAASYGVAIDMIAGPSEVLVIADQEASARIVAADLISQAEHGNDSQVVLVTPSQAVLDETLAELELQLEDLPRKEFARKALDQSLALLVTTLEEALEFSNLYAPEHLILNLRDARERLGHVQSAGSVFVGSWTPEVAGDYASGTNHTLPTSGLARHTSGVSMESFIKKITFQEITQEGLQALAPTLETIAELEQLEGHARAVKHRLRLEESDE